MEQPATQSPTFSARHGRLIGGAIILGILGLFIGSRVYRMFQERQETDQQLTSCLEHKIASNSSSAEIQGVLCECGTSVSVGIEGVSSNYRQQVKNRIDVGDTLRLISPTQSVEFTLAKIYSLSGEEVTSAHG
jgi:hypothetical protein